MNVYDFDNTIYDGDSSINFILFCYKNYFCCMYKYIPEHLYLCFRILLSSHDKRTQYKSKVFKFLKDIKDINLCLDKFSDKEKTKIKKWYFERQKKDDLVITASPEFIVKSICNKVNINYVIGTKMDKENGHICGLNCKGREKANRFKLIYRNSIIDEFYSDSKTDRYMFELARMPYYVNGNKIRMMKKS